MGWIRCTNDADDDDEVVQPPFPQFCHRDPQSLDAAGTLEGLAHGDGSTTSGSPSNSAKSSIPAP